MKKIILSAVATLTVASMVNPAFAASNNTQKADKNMIVVAQGDGYVVTNDISPKKTKQVSDTEITPNSTTYSSMTLANHSGVGFSGHTYTSYGNGQLQDTSTMTVSYQHNTFSDDYIWANGAQNAYWSGSSPAFSATNIYMAPKEIATATAPAYSVSSSGSVSVSISTSTATMAWPQIPNANAYSANYSWAKWELGTSCHFSDLKASDYITWQFGTSSTGQLNVIDVSIS